MLERVGGTIVGRFALDQSGAVQERDMAWQAALWLTAALRRQAWSCAVATALTALTRKNGGMRRHRNRSTLS
jgi:hypothetical protein